MTNKPSVKNYQSITLFLQHFYEFKKEQNPQFSFSTWAQELGMKSRGYLRLISVGERPINQSTLDAFLAYFQFEATDADYFVALVNYNQSKNREQKNLFGKKLLNYQLANQNTLEIEDHYEFLSHPILPRLQTLLSFHDLAENPQQIASLLKVTSEELGEALLQLEKLSLIEKQNSQWRTRKKSWRLPNNFRNLAYREFYTGTLKNVEKAIDAFEPDERRFRNLFLAMNQEEFQDFLSDFEVFVQEQSAKRDPTHFEGRKLYQLNFNFFPCSEKPTEEASTNAVQGGAPQIVPSSKA